MQTRTTANTARHGGFRIKDLARRAAALLTLCALVIPLHAAESQRLENTIPQMVKSLKPVGALPASQTLELALTLPVRNEAKFEQLFKEVSDPFSPNYRHFLNHRQFAEQFGASENDYQRLQNFAAMYGLKITARHQDRTLLSLRGSVSAIERAFQVNMRTYRHPVEDREFFSADADPTIRCAVAGVRVIGLDNFASAQRRMSKVRSISPKPASGRTGTGPEGTYWGYDFRNVYASGVSLTGTGQKVALVEFDGYYPADIASYTSQSGLPSVPLTNVYVNSSVVTAGPYNSEVAGDIEMVNAMAPGLAAIVVYESTNTTQPGVIDLLTKIKEDNSARQISMSWTFPTAGYGSYSNFDSIFKTFAIQGQTLFGCAGDQDAQQLQQYYNDDPYMTIVGGTVVDTDGANWASEIVWNSGAASSYNGTAGGVSSNYTIPSWQLGTSMAANGGSATFRNYPDVSIVASNIFVTVDNGQEWMNEGTSFSSPLWAGLNALVNEQAAANGLPSVGFLNPLLYAIGNSGLYANSFHDITSGNNTFANWTGTYYSAAPGYDLVSGWGTPNGSNLINYLAGPPQQFPAISDLHDFVNGADGCGPFSTLTLSGSTLYATAAQGGNGNCGTIYSMATSGSNFTTLYTFTNGVDGGFPYSPLTVSGSTMYGTASIGGVSNNGTIFSISTSGAAFNVLHSFNGNDGDVTESPLLLSGGTLYGMSANGGAANAGVIFSVSTSGSNFKILYTFTNGVDGAWPYGGLVIANSTLYGAAYGGGNSGDGTVFSIPAAGGNLHVIHSFTGGNDGGGPNGGVTLAGNTLYGSAATGGSGQAGTIFSLATSGAAFNVLYTFTNGIDGSTPYSALSLTGNTLYGTASAGGTWGNGTVFSLATNGSSFSTLHCFNGADGLIPYSAPVFSGDVLYGTTIEGGSANDGLVFALPLMFMTDWFAAEGNAGDSAPYVPGVSTNFVSPTTTNISYTTGISGDAFQFTGNSCVNFGTNIGNFGTNNFAVDFWIQTTAINAQTILSKRPNCNYNSQWGLRMGGNGTLNFTICANTSGTDSKVITSNIAINDGNFHHIAAVRLGLDVYLYIDGALAAEGGTSSIANISNTTAMTAGWETCTAGESAFDGALDEIKLYVY